MRLFRAPVIYAGKKRLRDSDDPQPLHQFRSPDRQRVQPSGGEQRRPYVELNLDQIVHDNIRKIRTPHFYFDEYRSNCPSNVMIYLQRMTLSKAPYVIGKCYISPYDLRDECGEEIPELFADHSEVRSF